MTKKLTPKQQALRKWPKADCWQGDWCCKHEQELVDIKIDLAYVHDTDGAALNAEVTARGKAEAECDRLRKDADRYRWLRCCTVAKFRELQHVNIVKGVHFDAQIDAEINAARKS